MSPRNCSTWVYKLKMVTGLQATKYSSKHCIFRRSHDGCCQSQMSPPPTSAPPNPIVQKYHTYLFFYAIKHNPFCFFLQLSFHAIDLSGRYGMLGSIGTTIRPQPHKLTAMTHSISFFSFDFPNEDDALLLFGLILTTLERTEHHHEVGFFLDVYSQLTSP